MSLTSHVSCRIDPKTIQSGLETPHTGELAVDPKRGRVLTVGLRIHPDLVGTRLERGHPDARERTGRVRSSRGTRSM